jgi:hypothetical protein
MIAFQSRPPMRTLSPSDDAAVGEKSRARAPNNGCSADAGHGGSLVGRQAVLLEHGEDRSLV